MVSEHPQYPVEAPQGPAQLVMLYDGLCAVCTATAEFIWARDHQKLIECVDLQQPEQAARFPRFTAEAVRAQMHAMDTENNTYIGVDALRMVFQKLPRWKWIAWPLAIPGIRQIAQFFYVFFARNRYIFNPILGNPKACKDDACAVNLDAIDTPSKTSDTP